MTTVNDLLAAARGRLDRPDPHRAAEMVLRGAILVDTRPGWQGAPDARIPEAVDHDVTWIVVCSEGYSSSLAAASLQDLGLHNATDLDGGYRAWKRAFGG
jgi:rhodanese-related sulfurtransferase